MALTVAELRAVFSSDTRGMDRGFAAIDRGAVRTRRGLSAVGKAAAGLFATLAGSAVVGFLKGAVGGASDLNETLNKSRVIFGSQAGAMDAWSRKAATSFGLSRQLALEAAAGFGDMFTQLGFTERGAAKMSRQVVQLSADLGSFNNLPTAEVLDMISASFRGEYDSLQRVIPNINAARVATEALTMTGKKSAEALTAQEKAAATLAIIQRDGARAAGDFARTSDSLANRQKILSAQWDDMKARLGAGLLPVVAGFVGLLSSKGIPALTATGETIASVAGFVSDHTGTVTVLAAALAALVVVTYAHAAALAVQSRGGLVPAAKALLTVLTSTRLVTAATKAYAAVQWALNAAHLASPLGLVAVLLVGLGVALVTAYRKSETFRDVVDGAFRAVGDAAGWLWRNAIQPLVDGMVTGFKAVARAGRWLWNEVLQPVFRFIVGGIAWLMDAWASMLNALGKVPGFEWAGRAGRAMEGAADRARGLARSIRNIPSGKRMRFTADTRQAHYAINSLHTSIASLQSLAARGIRVAGVTGYGGFTARAWGGPVKGGVPYLVGERGMELFVPEVNGRIIPNHELPASMPTPLARTGGGGGSLDPDVVQLLREIDRRLSRLGDEVARGAQAGTAAGMSGLNQSGYMARGVI